MILLGLGGVIHTPHTLEPFQELGLDTYLATKLALKLHAHFFQHAVLINLLEPDVLLRRLLSTLITNIRHGLSPCRLLLVTLLIPIDIFNLVSPGEGDTRCLGPRHPLFLNLCGGNQFLPLFPLSKGCCALQILHFNFGSRTTDLLFSWSVIAGNKATIQGLRAYAWRKGLTVNTSKSEVMHLNSRSCSSLPTFMYGNVQMQLFPKKTSSGTSSSAFLLTSTYMHHMNINVSEYAVQPYKDEGVFEEWATCFALAF
eukprot:9253-Pelagomonas_calceolata.AAC.1